MRIEELPVFIRTRHRVVTMTNNVIKAKINVKLCSKPIKRVIPGSPMYYSVYL